jgi:hypothetical protein
LWKKNKNGKIVRDRDNRIDCERVLKGQYKKSLISKEYEPLTVYFTYHKDCYIKAIKEKWER